MTVKEYEEAILKKGNKDLANFIIDNFGIKQSTNGTKDHFQILKMLSDDLLIVGIARMDQIETDYDISKHYPLLLGILGIMFGAYQFTFGPLLIFVSASITSLFMLLSMKNERKIRRAAVYLRSLLIQIKDSKSTL